jgi:Holliday junction resolvase RusA-like endonuclease
MKIIIEGEPIAKKRHKCACIGGKPRAYDPQLKDEMESIKEKMRSAVRQAFDSNDKEIVMEASNLASAQSYVVGLVFVFPINDRSTNSKEMASNNAKLWGLTPHTSKPDGDNLEKLYFDCGNGILWEDDSQITKLLFKEKKYGSNPRTEITILKNKTPTLSLKAGNTLKCISPEKVHLLIDYASHLLSLSINNTTITKTDDLYLNSKDLEELGNVIYNMAFSFVDDFKRIKKAAIDEG